MKLNSVSNECQRLLASFRRCDAPREDRARKRRKTLALLRRQRGIAFTNLLRLQTGLLQYTVESTGRNVGPRLAGDGYGSRFRRVLELAMASLRANQNPSVRFDQRDLPREPSPAQPTIVRDRGHEPSDRALQVLPEAQVVRLASGLSRSALAIMRAVGSMLC